MNISISELMGKTLSKVVATDDTIVFTTNDNQLYQMYHEQDCCESVTIEDINGDLVDLVGSPILIAEEVRNDEFEANWAANNKYEWVESYTWTFYKIATIKGYVTIRWFGQSNGYYSESVDFCKIIE